MNKVLMFVLALVMPAVAMADDVTPNNLKLDLNVRRVGLELSKTQVTHAREYAESPVSALNADSQDFIKGIFDTALEYRRDRLNWDNSLFMEYGRTTLKPYNGPVTVNDNADKILLSSDLSYECWEFGGLSFGPTVRGAYETQFRDNADAPRQNILRASPGISLFNHKVVKNLYLTGVYEYDFTYGHRQTSKLGSEFGWRIEYEIRDGVKLSTNGYYREFFDYSEFVPQDLKRDLSAIGRLDTNLWGDLTMGPYVQYRLAKARGIDVYGSNFVIGISFNYITKFKLLDN